MPTLVASMLSYFKKFMFMPTIGIAIGGLALAPIVTLRGVGKDSRPPAHATNEGPRARGSRGVAPAPPLPPPTQTCKILRKPRLLSALGLSGRAVWRPRLEPPLAL
eukprot:scaffold5221_cov122-Isochrysis_galbana.AAC.1